MDPAQRRQAILHAAEKVFSQKGYHAAGISDIIEAAGIARGTFYRYFDNKRAIFEAILDDFLDLIRRQLRPVDVNFPTVQPVDQIHNQLIRVFHTLYDNAALTNVLLTQAVGLDPGFDEKLETFYSTLVELAEGSLRTGIALGLVRPCHTAIVARCMVGAVKELMEDVARGRPRFDIDLLLRSVVDLFMRGVARDPAAFAAYIATGRPEASSAAGDMVERHGV